MELSSKHDSWKLALENNWSNTSMNAKMPDIVSLLKQGLSAVDCIQNIRENPGFAALAVDHFQNIVLLRNISVLGPSLRVPEQKVLSLSSTGRFADCLRLHESIFDSNLSVDAPGWADLKRASTADEVLALVVPENAAKQKFKSLIMVPPLVATAVMSSDSSKAVDLIPILSRAFQAYDRELSAEGQKACEHLRVVLFFLWAASKCIVPPFIMAIDKSPDSLDWSATLHSKHIAPILPPPVLPAPVSVDCESNSSENGTGQSSVFGNIADTLKLLTEASCKDMLKEPTSTKSTKESLATELLPEVIRRMIVRMSSSQDDAFPEDFCPTLKVIMAQKKIIPATQVLHFMMRTMKCQVKITASLVTAIRTGNFQPDNLMSSHPYSPFATGYADSSNADTQQQIKLDLMRSEGKVYPKK